MNKHAIGIDLGGTRVKGVLVDQDGIVLEQRNEQIGAGDWKNIICEMVQQFRSRAKENTDVGISAPGIPNEDNTAIAFMPGRLEGLEGLVWSELLGVPAVVVNDAIAALAAEVRFGEARGYRHAFMLTLGTGVGGAILADGKIYQGAFQKAGHLGHISIDHEGEPDVTGMPGSLEDAIGNCTLGKRSCGKFRHTHELLAALDSGNGFAEEVWNTSVRKLAIGIASLTNVLSPEIIILGGGITEAGARLFDPLEHFLARYEWRAGGHRARLTRAKFGDMAGAIGAAGYAFIQNQ